MLFYRYDIIAIVLLCKTKTKLTETRNLKQKIICLKLTTREIFTCDEI